MKHLKKFESYRDTDDKLYRLLSKYYRDFLNSRLDDVDPDRRVLIWILRMIL
jgi:hypothetical protein